MLGCLNGIKEWRVERSEKFVLCIYIELYEFIWLVAAEVNNGQSQREVVHYTSSVNIQPDSPFAPRYFPRVAHRSTFTRWRPLHHPTSFFIKQFFGLWPQSIHSPNFYDCTGNFTFFSQFKPKMVIHPPIFRSPTGRVGTPLSFNSISNFIQKLVY